LSKYAAREDALQGQILLLSGFLVFSILGNVGLWWGWSQAPRDIRINIPPSLRHGAVVRPDEHFAANVESFAISTFRQLNRWDEDGAKDYGQNIFDAQVYLTPRYREWLLTDMESKAIAGELRDRTRYTLELDDLSTFGEKTKQFDDGSWLVNVRLMIVERVAGVEAKRVGVDYPIRVVRMNVSPLKNPWGLALDGYPEGMQETRIEGARAKNDA